MQSASIVAQSITIECFPPPPVGENKNVLRTNAFGECFANVFDDISYGVGINPKDFQLLRSTE